MTKNRNPQNNDRGLMLAALLAGSLLALGVAAWVLRNHHTELLAVLIGLPPALLWGYRSLIWPDRFPPAPTVKPTVKPAQAVPAPPEPPADTHYELEWTSPFQAGERLSGWLTAPLTEAERLEAEGLTETRWLFLWQGKQQESVAATLERVDPSPGAGAKFRLTLTIPRYLSGNHWKLLIGSQSFFLPPLLPAQLRPLLEPPLTPAQAAEALLEGQEQPTLRRLYGLTAAEYVTYEDVTPAERRAAFALSDAELAAFAVKGGWSQQHTDTAIRWEGGPFLHQQPDGSFRVVSWAERGRVEVIGVAHDLTEATRLLLRERFSWLPETP